MKFNQLLILFMLFPTFLISKKAYSQDSIAVQQNYKFGIGAGAGFTTGYGLSFRYTPTKFGMQLNFAPYKDDFTNRISLGLTFIYKINEGKNVNLFLYQANHYFYHSEKYYDTYNSYPYTYSYSNQKYVDEYMNNGIGFGFEFIFAKKMSFNLMTGFAAYRNFSQIKMTGETGLYFKF